MHPIEIVYQALTHIMAPAMGPPTETDSPCSCCGRPAEAFEHLGFVGVDSYKTPVNHCSACQSFFTSDVELMGVENPKKPTTSQKFGMWKGVGAIIEIDKMQATLLAPPGVTKKIPEAFPKSIKIIECTLGEQFKWLAQQELSYPLIYIRNFGVKTKLLIQGLTVSTSPDALFCCTDDGMDSTTRVQHTVNLNKMFAIRDALAQMEKKAINPFILTINGLAKGKISPKEASQKFKAVPDLVNIVQMLPADPHERVALLSMVKKELG